MTAEEHCIFTQLADAYRILREAYHKDMGRGEPPMNALQIRVREILAHPTND